MGNLDKSRMQKYFFSHGMIKYMVKHYNIEEVKAGFMVSKYIGEIDVESAIAQHLGVDYFALQILMAEGIIPYKPM